MKEINIVEDLRDSDSYEEAYINSKRAHEYDHMKTWHFQHVIDAESNTVVEVAVKLPKESWSATVKAVFYFEIEDQPYWLKTYVEDFDELKEFEADSMEMMVTMVNRYEDY